MVGAVASTGEHDFRIVRSKVIVEEGGDDFPSGHSRYAVVDQGFQSLEVADPFVTRNDSWLWHFFQCWRAWLVVTTDFFVFIICGWWRSGIDRVRGAGSWWKKDIRVGNEQWFIVGYCSWGRRGGDWYKIFVEEYRSMDDGLFHGVSVDEYESSYGSGWRVEDTRRTISCLGVPSESLDGVAKDNSSFGFFFLFCESHH